jgi:hypothetical protein
MSEMVFKREFRRWPTISMDLIHRSVIS